MFLSLLTLAGATFTGLYGNNTSVNVYKTSPSTSSSAILGSGYNDSLFIYEELNLDSEDSEFKFQLNYDNETYTLMDISFTSHSSYLSIEVNVPFQSNLRYQLYLSAGGVEADNYKFFAPEFLNMEENPLFYTYFGEGTTSQSYNITYDDNVGSSDYSSVRFGLWVTPLDEETYNRLDPVYGTLYNNGYNEGYNTGYNAGNSNGYDTGYSAGEQVGYQNGYVAGFEEADNQDSTALTIFTGIINVGLLPVNVFLSVLNFEVFGINIGALVSSFLTIAIVVILWRIISGNKND